MNRITRLNSLRMYIFTSYIFKSVGYLATVVTAGEFLGPDATHAVSKVGTCL
jgi:hypothetical protein